MPGRAAFPRARVKRIGYVGLLTDDVAGMTRFLRDVQLVQS